VIVFDAIVIVLVSFVLRFGGAEAPLVIKLSLSLP